jgi:dihydrofolate reductase
MSAPPSRPAAAPVLCLIVAVADNGVIGLNGKMPWHLPAELKYFKARTLGKPVIMGRKTFQPIGKPLPGRDNIVVTRDVGFQAPGVLVAQSLAQAIEIADASAARTRAAEIMVIGGGEIYAQALPFVQRVYLTRIGLMPVGDAHFPSLDPAHWRLMAQTPIPGLDEGGPTATACVYERVVHQAS